MERLSCICLCKKEEASSLFIKLPSSVNNATVLLPVDQLSTTAVAVDAKTGEIIKLSYVTENGMIIAVSDSIEIVIRDNAKSFIDVSQDAWYQAAVAFASSREIMNGVGNDRFAPETPLTRAMITQMLFNLENGKKQGPASFTDISQDAWYSNAVNWAAANKIITGYGDGRFGPEDSITREQMVVILYRYAANKGYDMDTSGNLKIFSDNGSISTYATDAMAWAVKNGIITGKSGNILDPTGNATRAEIATILMRFCRMLLK